MDGVKFALRLAAVATVSAFSLSAVAQSVSASAEISRRTSDSQAAFELVEKGDAAYQKGDYAAAVESYREAVAKLPAQANVVSDFRQATVQRFVQAAVERARNLGRKGDYPAANSLLDEVDLLRPDDYSAAEMRGRLQDPIRSNPGGSKEHTALVDRVRRGLYEAEGFLNLGKFDRAFLAYEDILRLDPYNKSARRGLEKVNFHKSSYAGAAYDHARAEILKDVDRAWENRSYEELEVPVIEGFGGPDGRLQIAATLEKLRLIKVEVIDFEDATLTEVVDFFRLISRQKDTTVLDESQKGIDFVLQLGSEDNPVGQKIRDARISLQLQHVTLEQALKTVTDIVGAQYRIDEFAVVVSPLGSLDETLVTRTFRVPPDFLTKDAINRQGDNQDPFADEKDRTGPLLAKRLTAHEKLVSMGVPFPEGSSVSFVPGNSALRVRNTIENLDFIAQIVSTAASSEPVQVVIRTTVIDVTEDGLEELGYDWILGQFGGRDLTLAGGSVGNGGNIDGFPTLPISQDVNAPVTSGLRSGDSISVVDGLDAVLTREIGGEIQGPARAPGAFSVGGVIGNGVAQMLVRGFSQKEGVDVLVKPEVVTRSGQNAVIKSVREFWYPTEYEPPELPNSSGGDSVATPSTPTTFTSTDLGVTLDVLPQVSADRTYVDISVSPKVRDFEGFINYGSPITGQFQSTNFNPLGFLTTNSATGEITSNEILMPLFRTTQASTEVTVADGSTVVIAGQMSQVSRNIEDKVPVLGDLPLIGRFFRSKGIDTTRRNVVILLNVELQDPSGKPYRNR